MSAYDDLLVDLAEETAALDDVVADLDEAGLARPTPAEGWSIADQLSHLAGFDEAATTAILDPDGFLADLDRRITEGDDPIAGYTAVGRAMTGAEVRDWWRRARGHLAAAAAPLDPKARIPWYGPPMSAMSFITARAMEAWAHGQDVRDALGLPPLVSARLRHVAHIGVGARAFSYLNNGIELPDTPIDVVLRAPDGSTWSWGPGDAADRVEGEAIDFCLAVTQRRHRDDLALVVTGAEAERWMGFAQAFAGAPGGGRHAGQFAD
ncbi:MAG: TIGR03084 family metal-binding protein [Acidimicrobiales bacterium]